MTLSLLLPEEPTHKFDKFNKFNYDGDIPQSVITEWYESLTTKPSMTTSTLTTMGMSGTIYGVSIIKSTKVTPAYFSFSDFELTKKAEEVTEKLAELEEDKESK